MLQIQQTGNQPWRRRGPAAFGQEVEGPARLDGGQLAVVPDEHDLRAGRIRLVNPTNGFEGDRSLAMDSVAGAALNEATLTVDLSGQTNVIFRCWTRDYADAAHPMPATFIGSTNADGIAVSADGLTMGTEPQETSAPTPLACST